ncbi:hypothetical protein [Kineosporia sp. NBRC 101731]|uniref:hypothetical protein n=1 Tax=Kineosporia sp. NBRC 101731 TaxID=3032199 RepID=UPI0024A1AA8D|nr:hypothetical protein [Kineosporia sp. NBRC 101731]GLY30739.1 hypothetical protein Kisp02_41040 [Kineosporia sp. NBRC 101731]
MTSPDSALDHLRTELRRRLASGDLDHVELTAATGPALRVDVVQAGQLFFWITVIATTDAEFDLASGARAAMRSFPWTMPFKPKLERRQASLPVLCRWQRAYVDDTADLCVTLLDKHFRVPLDTVKISGPVPADISTDVGPPPPTAAKQQKIWLRDITAWFMRTRT